MKLEQLNAVKGIVANLLLVLAVICLIAGVAFRCQEQREAQTITHIDTTRVVVYDTVTYRQPIAVDSVVLRYETIKVRKVVNDTIRVLDSAEDSVAVEIPITQKHYADSTYSAWVSGYDPCLDSIKVYPRTEVVTITKQIQDKPKRWGIGIHGGVGISKGGFTPYIGIGVQYNIIRW
jgi:opacity protein-like surface antigen